MRSRAFARLAWGSHGYNLLVILGPVADNDSVARAVVLGVHPFKAFLLATALALTAPWALAAVTAPGHAFPAGAAPAIRR